MTFKNLAVNDGVNIYRDVMTSPLICGDIRLLSRYDVSSSEMEVDLIPGGL